MQLKWRGNRLLLGVYCLVMKYDLGGVSRGIGVHATMERVAW